MVLIDEQKQQLAVPGATLPPSYDCATQKETYSRPEDKRLETRSMEEEASHSSRTSPLQAEPSMRPPFSVTHTGNSLMYRYTDPYTYEEFDSPLPPHHPDMRCLSIGHDPRSTYGIGGVAIAFVTFPLGLPLMFLDRDVICRRCRKVLKVGTKWFGGNGKPKSVE